MARGGGSTASLKRGEGRAQRAEWRETGRDERAAETKSLERLTRHVARRAFDAQEFTDIFFQKCTLICARRELDKPGIFWIPMCSRIAFNYVKFLLCNG